MESYDPEDEKIERLLQSVQNLKALHEDVCMTEHAMYERHKRYMPYEPTYFLYNYFCFNTVFSIDWEASIKEGTVQDGEQSEEKRIKKLIDFCFSYSGFADSFFPTFLEIVTVRFGVSEITKAMESIVIDNKRIDDDFINSFKSACGKVLTEKGFTVRDLKTVFSFIYAVRCNIVHGTKSMQDMREPGQRTRILVYSYFIIALVHMLFMNLKCRIEGFYRASMSESFLWRLKDYMLHYQINETHLR